MNGSTANDQKSCQSGEDRLPFPSADLHYFAPTAAGAIEHLPAGKFEEPIDGMQPVPAFDLAPA